MKTKLHILLLSAMLLTACGGDNPEPLGPASADMLLLSPRDISMEATQTSATFLLESNCYWTITADATWDGLLVSPMQGSGTQHVSISTPANPYNAARQSLFTVSTSDGIATHISLTQSAGDVVLLLSEHQLTCQAQGDEKSVTVQSNVEWTVSTSAAWVTTSLDGGRYDQDITVACAPNPSDSAREATVSFWYNGAVRQQLALRQLSGTRPAIAHAAVSTIGRSAATVGFVCSAGDFPVVECGVWWGTGSNPRETGTRQVAQADADGHVVVWLEGLSSATYYNVVPYAVNAVGEVVGDVLQFQTLAIPGKDDNTPPSQP